MKRILLALMLLPFYSMAQQDCKPVQNTSKAERLLVETNRYGGENWGEAELMYTIQLGVFTNEPEKLPPGCIAYPFLIHHDGVEKKMWLVMYEGSYYRKEDAIAIRDFFNSEYACGAYIKPIKRSVK